MLSDFSRDTVREIDNLLKVVVALELGLSETDAEKVVLLDDEADKDISRDELLLKLGESVIDFD